MSLLHDVSTTKSGQIKYVEGNRFILKGDMNEGKNIKITPMSQETLVLFTEAMHDIKWKGLAVKNSDKMYAPRQFMPWSEYVRSHKEVIEGNK